MATIKLDHVSVSFPVYASATRSIKNRLMHSATGGQIHTGSGTNRITVVEALQDINLDLKTGDRIGLVGHNGAGKTTLLRVLASIYEPNQGSVSIIGKTAPLFDIRLGMDPESTGYENILLRGLYLGLTRRQISAHIDDIADFTELGDFLDLPIRTYSAGMQMRLAFAISTAVPPDILLLDEGIGAGDAAFLQKASERLRAFTEQVSIIVLSSHSEFLIRQMCNNALLMEHGRVIGSGATEDVLEEYRLLLNLGGELAGPVVNSPSQLIENTNIAPQFAEPLRGVKTESSARWAEKTAFLLKKKRWNEVNLERLIYELEQLATQASPSLGEAACPSGSTFDVGELVKDLAKNLFLWYFISEERTIVNREIINQTRERLLVAIEANPSLYDSISNSLNDTYPIQLDAAAHSAGIDATNFPRKCPIDIHTFLNKKWFPGIENQ